VPRLKEAYVGQVVPAYLKEKGLSNVLQVPRLKKIVINVGVSDARDNAKAIDVTVQDLTAITGQRPEVRRARQSISNFKLRQGMPIGVRVTLRGTRMYEFLDRLIALAIPRIRDFQGLNPKVGFDGMGNFNLGLREQYMFPEIDLDKSEKARGMNITVVTTAGGNDAAREFLTLMGMPFRKAAPGRN